MFLDFKQDQWLDTAVSGIRFHLDRKRVRRELEGHHGGPGGAENRPGQGA